MDQSSFDRIARLLGGASTRRTGLRAMVGAALGIGTAAAAGPLRADARPGKQGPCGNGSRKDNICSKNKDCCTGVCNTSVSKANRDGKGRCRCVRKGNACIADRNCCNGLPCTGSVCGGTPAPVCTVTPDVCPSGCAHATIQAAIDAAATGATIVIGEGLYVEALSVADKSLVLAGCPTATIKDPGGVRTVTVSEGTLELKDLRIDGTGSSSAVGGGIACEGSLTLSGTTTVTNGFTDSYGGGVFLSNFGALFMQDSASIEGCGGGIGGGGLVMGLNCTLAMSGAATISNCTANRFGGGLFAGSDSAITMTATSAISGNRVTFESGQGGGVYLFGATMTMSGSSAVRANFSEKYGGGFFLTNGAGPSSLTLTESATVTGNTSTGANTGSGVYAPDSGNSVTGGSAITGNTPDPQCYGVTC